MPKFESRSESTPCSAAWLIVCCRPAAELLISLERVCDGAVGALAPTAVYRGTTVEFHTDVREERIGFSIKSARAVTPDEISMLSTETSFVCGKRLYATPSTLLMISDASLNEGITIVASNSIGMFGMFEAPNVPVVRLPKFVSTPAMSTLRS